MFKQEEEITLQCEQIQLNKKKELLNYFRAQEKKILGQEIMSPPRSTGRMDVRNGYQS